MFGLYIPPSTNNFPAIWWLFWMAVAVVCYSLLFFWFRAAFRKETREPTEAELKAHRESGGEG